jgi:hypothetical protein
MNKYLKYTILASNLVMMYFAYEWLISSNEYEPKIVLIGQFITILGLLFESKFSSVKIKGITNSDVDLSTTIDDTTNYNVSDIKDRSNIKIEKK